MNGILLTIAFLLAAPGSVYALSRFQVPLPVTTGKTVKRVSQQQINQERAVGHQEISGSRSQSRIQKVIRNGQSRVVTEPVRSLMGSPLRNQRKVQLRKRDDGRISHSRAVMPILLEYLPYAQALQEGIPGITATPLPNNLTSMTLALVIPLAPEDLPIQSQKAREDLRDALGPVNEARHAPDSRHCALRHAGRCPFSQIEPAPKDIKFCKSDHRLLWWTRILPAPAFNILLQKLRLPWNKPPKPETGCSPAFR